MLDWRTLALGFGVFAATFAGGWWLDVANLVSRVTVSDAKPTSVASALPAPVAQPPAQAKTVDLGKGLTDDDRLRQAVILRAKAYHNPACNQDARTLYVRAASEYAEVLLRAAGCHSAPSCRLGTGALEQVWSLNRSARDLAVAEAMAGVSEAGGLTERDFRGDIGRAVRVIAGTEFRGGSGPECTNERGRRRGWRIRWRF